MSTFNYVELFVPEENLEQTKAFFESVFDWKLEPFGEPGYWVHSRGEGPGVDAGLGKSQDGAAFLSAALTVENIDATLRQVEAHGGTVVVPKYAIPTVGEIAYFKDPNGLIMGVHQPAGE